MILVTVVIPKITRVFADMGQTLPGITLLLMAITDFIRNFKWFLLLGAVVAAVLLNRSVKSKEGRTIFDRFRLAIPILGNLIHKRDLARFSRTLGNLLRNGVPILTALEIAQEVVSNVIIRREVEKLPGAISQGTSMAASLSDSPHFPSFMVSMIAIGEETAQLDGVLLRIAETYESQVDRSVKTLTSVLEPLIILALGVVVGFIVIAMMLPIMTLDPMQGGE
jgi:type II secretory pathway component PulF